MKKVLVISPYFPPTNAADMQRIRMSLPYFNGFGWEAEIVTVNPVHSDLQIDRLLLESIPPETIIHQVQAVPKKLTAPFGLGSIALRSIWFYQRKVNALLKDNKYDLIYFSTTQFPICILGAYWKKRFGIPYVIDMQDPWHSEYYQDKPKNKRPSKYWFSYRLNKWLEPQAMKEVGGLISVSNVYIDDLKKRYPGIKNIPEAVIPFCALEKDFEVVKNKVAQLKSSVKPEKGKINIVYVGRGGYDMESSVKLLFMALLKGSSSEPELFKQYHIYFIGTSYAANGEGLETLTTLAESMGLRYQVTETTDRIGFYESITTLQNADILFIPGSDDPRYTASKLFSYLLSQKPILAIFHEKSSAVNILRSCSPESHLFTFPGNIEKMIDHIYDQLLKWSKEEIKPSSIDLCAFSQYSASMMTGRQTEIFNSVVADMKTSTPKY